MDWPEKHDDVALIPNISSGYGTRDCAPAALSERMVTHSAQALLVFADPVMIDCQRRKWPVSFQQLFNTGRFAGLATNETDVHIFTSVEPGASKSRPYTVHLQKYTGASFGERLEDAVERLAMLGYRKIVIVGSDCPSLEAHDISRTFQLLEQKRLVLGPDHRGGCYLIGLHAEDRAQLAGIRWHQNADFAELLRRYGEGSTAQLPVKIDLDTLEDLRLLAQSKNVWSALAATLLQLLDVVHCETKELSRRNTTRHQTLSWQLPPPFFANA
jgi:2-phospho-L-lactate guanylyltransferase (CobY/MobA/RfbA family)